MIMVSHLLLPCNTRQTFSIIKVLVIYFLFGKDLVSILSTINCVPTLHYWECHFLCVVICNILHTRMNWMIKMLHFPANEMTSHPQSSILKQNIVNVMSFVHICKLLTILQMVKCGKFLILCVCRMLVKISDCSLLRRCTCSEGTYCTTLQFTVRKPFWPAIYHCPAVW